MTSVRGLVKGARPHKSVPTIKAAERIFKVKTELYMDSISRYSHELDCTGISIDDSTGALVAASDVIPTKLCLPFFGDVTTGEIKADTPKLTLGTFMGVTFSMVPSGGNSGNLMCPAWNTAFTNEEQYANVKLESVQVSVRFQDIKPKATPKQVPVRKRTTLEDAASQPQQKKLRMARQTPSDPQSPPANYGDAADAKAMVAVADTDAADADAMVADDATPPTDEVVEIVATFDAYRIVAIPGRRAGPLCRVADATTPKTFGKLVTKSRAAFKRIALANGVLTHDEGTAVENAPVKMQKPEIYFKHIHG